MGKRRFLCSLLVLILLSISFTALAQEKKITLKLSKVALPTAFRQVEEQSAYYKVNYAQNEVKGYQVSADIQDADAIEAVRALIKDLPLKLSVNGRFIQISRDEKKQVVSEGRTIRGKVVDADGEPLPGVNVRVAGADTGVITDIDGNYVLVDVAPNSQLVYSYIGKKPMERKASARQSTIILEDAISTMDEVVVNGIQTIEKGRATGAFSILNQKSMDNIYSNSLTDKLESIVPGLYVDQKKGISIRGVNTLSATTAPLVVVDGFPMESSELNLNPNDIEQVTVLKDAASASIWGIRAANGVIVITTKRGNKEQHTEVNYNGTFTVGSKPDWDDLHLLNSNEYVNLEFDKLVGRGITKTAYNGFNPIEKIAHSYLNGALTLDQARSQLGILGQFNNANQIVENFYRRPFSQQHNVSINGGSKNVATYISLNFDQNKSQQRGDEYNKFNVLFNNDLQLHPKLNVGLSMRATYIKQDDNGADMTDYEPWRRILNNDGTYYDENFAVSEEWQSALYNIGLKDWHQNSLENILTNDHTTKGYDAAAQLKLLWQPIRGLELSSQGSYEVGNQEIIDFHSEDSYFTRNLVNTYATVAIGESGLPESLVRFNIPAEGGIKDIANTHTISYSVRNTISYANQVKELDYKVMAGQEVYELRGHTFSDRLFGFNTDLLTGQSVDLATLQGGVSGWNGITQSLNYSTNYSETLHRYVSYFGTASATYREKYNLFGSLRLDQTNLLTNASKFRNNPSWSVGGKWDISKEVFMKTSWIDKLSLRLAYGMSGNIDKTTSPDMVATASTAAFIRSLTYLAVSNPANPSLGWEKTYSLNLGIDYSLLKNRLSGSVDIYRKQSKGLLANVNTDPTVGWTSVRMNSAEVGNYGIDLTLHANILTQTPVRWSSALNFSYNHNEVTKIYYEPSVAGAHRIIGHSPLEGQPVDYIATIRYGGLDENGEPTFLKGGDDKKHPYTELSTLTLDDLKYEGRSTPPVFGSWINELRYRDLTFSVMFTYRLGYKMRLPAPYPSMFGPYTEWFGEQYRWVEGQDNIGKWVPAVYTDSYYAPDDRDNCFLHSDQLVDKGDVIYLKSIVLTYNVSKLLHHIGLHGGSIRLSGENLWYWAANKYGLDPDQMDSTTHLYEYTSTLRTNRPRLVAGLSINF